MFKKIKFKQLKVISFFLAIISPLIAMADSQYGNGTFYVINNTPNILNLTIVNNACAEMPLFTTHLPASTNNSISQILSGQKIALTYNYSVQCASTDKSQESLINFTITDPITSASAQFKTSLGSINNPQSAHFWYDLNPKFTVKSNSTTMTIIKENN